MEYLTKRIKKDIQDGGIVIAPRRAGKTVAIMDLLEQSDDYVLVCCTKTCAESIRKDIVERGVKDKEKVNNCVFGPKDAALDKCKKKIIIDEFFWNPFFYRSNFLKYHCAVSSAPLKLFVYNKKGKKLIMDMDEYITEK
jgi:hypothetical protein